MNKFDFDFEGLPSQDSIKSKWAFGESIKVSVIVTCYNHGPYISDCLKGILCQVTSFPFEIIVHDDASSDSSVEQVERFCEKYPDLIRPIFQAENQYSKGCNRPLIIAASVCSSKYLAICEGDDYWVNPMKLSRQVEAIERNEGCSIVVHEALVVSGSSHSVFRRPIDCERFGVKDILAEFGQFAPTASYLFDRKVFDILPKWFETAPVGDFLIEIYSQKVGFGLFLEGSDSVYRYLSVGSWSSNLSKGKEARAIAIKRLIDIYEKVSLDFPGFLDDINVRKTKAYAALAFQLSRLDLLQVFSRQNNISYREIKGLAAELNSSSVFFRIIKFPPWFPLFIVGYCFSLGCKKFYSMVRN